VQISSRAPYIKYVWGWRATLRANAWLRQGSGTGTSVFYPIVESEPRTDVVQYTVHSIVAGLNGSDINSELWY
jgi:hypothetical protein